MTLSARVFRSSLATGLVVSLAACGGGSGETGTSGPTVPTVQPTPFPETQSTATSLVDTYLDADGRLLSAFSVVPGDQIPTTGTARYSGFLVGSAGGQDLVASLSVEADFAGADLAATASAFQRSDGSDLSGMVTGNGLISRDAGASAPQLQMTLSGTVGGESAAILLDGALVGSGGGTSITSIAGQAEGTIGADILENGRFAAE